jgi:putative ABC transport system permease protein
VGKRVKGWDPRGPNGGKNDDWLTVVGVVRDMHSAGAERLPFSQIYEPQKQSNERIGRLVIRTRGNPAQFAAAAHAALREASPNARIAAVTTMNEELDSQEAERRLQTWITGLFSAVALALAALGVFAVMHFSVAAKTREIGIRMAVGARPGDILGATLRDGARLAVAGITLGALASVWLTNAIRGLLFGVKPGDAASFGVAGVLLAGVSLAACYLPARRAARLDPVSALRED